MNPLESNVDISDQFWARASIMLGTDRANSIDMLRMWQNYAIVHRISGPYKKFKKTVNVQAFNGLEQQPL